MRQIEAVFIDCDGTIGGTGHFIHPRDFQPYTYSVEAIRLLKANKLRSFALSNQHRISKGEATLQDFEQEFDLFGLDDAFICPHSSAAGCNCHKPRTGLLEKAATVHQHDLTKTAVIGDVGATDMLAADKVGAYKILVRTGWGEKSLGRFRHTWKDTKPDYIALNLLEAVKWIIKHNNGKGNTI